MSNIPLPQQLKVEELNPHHAAITIEPCYPGYGTTLGNALRRVMLSSLPGSAITAVKFEGVPHEFTSIPFVKEDVIDLILNLKRVRLSSFSEEPVTLTLKVRGVKVVTAGDFAPHAEVSISNPDVPLATLTDAKASLALEVTVQRGRGYLPVEAREKEKLELGTIAIDALFSPVVNVGMKVENVRVEQFTNYERLTLSVETDGTLSPAAAVASAGEILLEQFNFVTESEAIQQARAVVESPGEQPAKPAKKSRAKKVIESAE